MILGVRRIFAALLPNLNHLGPMMGRHRRSFLLGYLCLAATSGFSLAIPLVLRRGINRLDDGDYHGLLVSAFLLVGLAAIAGVFRYFMRMILIGASRRLEYELRDDFLAHLQTLSLSFFNRQKTGDLMARASNDLSAVRDVLGPGVMYGMNTVTTVTASLVLMIYVDPWLTLFTLIPLPILAILVRHFAAEIHKRSRAVQDQYGLVSSGVQENISGIRVVQSYVQERHEEAHFGKLNSDYTQLGFRLIRSRALFFATMGGLVEVLMLVLLWAGGVRIIRGQIDFGHQCSSHS